MLLPPDRPTTQSKHPQPSTLLPLCLFLALVPWPVARVRGFARMPVLRQAPLARSARLPRHITIRDPTTESTCSSPPPPSPSPPKPPPRHRRRASVRVRALSISSLRPSHHLFHYPGPHQPWACLSTPVRPGSTLQLRTSASLQHSITTGLPRTLTATFLVWLWLSTTLGSGSLHSWFFMAPPASAGAR